MANTFSSGDVSKAICDRCRFRYFYRELQADHDKPGLRVCEFCVDARDPWRLPPHQQEAIALRYPRPDVDLATGTTNEWDTELFWDAPGYQWDVPNNGINNT